MTINKQIELRNGRKLGYAEYGCKDGFPALFFHGLPGSRLEAEKLHGAALKTNVRLMGLDRPGMGLSSIQNNRLVLDWAKDIDEFATLLKLNTFSMIGHSGGAPYVAACAYHIPSRIHKAVIVSGIAPLTYSEAVKSLHPSQKYMFWITKYCPVLLKWIMRSSFKTLQNPNQFKKMLSQLPDIDKQIFTNADYERSMILSLQEAFRQDISEVVNDFKLVIKPWGFNLEDIKCPITIWQGGKDQQAPVKHADLYAKHLTEVNYMYLEDEGHISILYHHGEQILISAL